MSDQQTNPMVLAGIALVVGLLIGSWRATPVKDHEPKEHWALHPSGSALLRIEQYSGRVDRYNVTKDSWEEIGTAEMKQLLDQIRRNPVTPLPK
jgi:hypothetical protein